MAHGCARGRGWQTPHAGLPWPGWEVLGSAFSPALHYNPVIEAIWWEGSQAGRLQVIRNDGGGCEGRSWQPRHPARRPEGPQPGKHCCPGTPPSSSGTALGPPPAPADTVPLPVPSASLLWTVCWRRCPAARRGSVLVCRGSWRAPVLCFAPSSPAWGGGAVVRTLRGSRSGGVGGTGPGGRAEPSRPAEPWRPGYPAETAAPSPLPTDVPGVPGLRPAPGRGPGPRSQTQAPQPHHAPAFGVPPPNPGLSLCNGSSWVASPAAEPPSSPALGPSLPAALGLGQQEDGAPRCAA